MTHMMVLEDMMILEEVHDHLLVVLLLRSHMEIVV